MRLVGAMFHFAADKEELVANCVAQQICKMTSALVSSWIASNSEERVEKSSFGSGRDTRLALSGKSNMGGGLGLDRVACSQNRI
jgi:hypothetical protein